MTDRPDDLCPHPPTPRESSTTPHAPPLYTTAVWRCGDADDAQAILEGRLPGYVYQRDAHPNADMLGETLGRLHGAERTAVTSCGMSALALAVLALCEAGDHLLASNQLYGRSSQLLLEESSRLGLASSAVDATDLAAVEKALRPETKLLVVETIANPLLRVADIAALADLAHQQNALLLIDNTFASPALCKPLVLGADLVLESGSKIINGHSDVMLGFLLGGEKLWERMARVSSVYGLASSPFDCWQAQRGLMTLHLRSERACANAQAIAEFLAARPEVSLTRYPGLAAHEDHQLAARQLTGGFGWMVAFDLAGGRAAADSFMAAVADTISFCPSLGEVGTTLTHPATTSHRGMSEAERQALGIGGGTIRLSVGTESPEFLREALLAGLSATS